ncbi:hypothetical protein LTR94_035934, partial [Friedmanniomyces endolithicus]
MLEGLLAEIDEDDGDVDARQLADQPAIIDRRLGLQIHHHDIRAQRDHLLDVEGTVLPAAEARQPGDLR